MLMNTYLAAIAATLLAACSTTPSLAEFEQQRAELALSRHLQATTQQELQGVVKQLDWALQSAHDSQQDAELAEQRANAVLSNNEIEDLDARALVLEQTIALWESSGMDPAQFRSELSDIRRRVDRHEDAILELDSRVTDHEGRLQEGEALRSALRAFAQSELERLDALGKEAKQ